METTKNQTVPKGKAGRPPQTAKPEVTVEIDGDYVVIRLPKKDLSRKLLAELI